MLPPPGEPRARVFLRDWTDYFRRCRAAVRQAEQLARSREVSCAFGPALRPERLATLKGVDAGRDSRWAVYRYAAVNRYDLVWLLQGDQWVPALTEQLRGWLIEDAAKESRGE